VQVMSWHPGGEGLQRLGCLVLGNLSDCNTDIVVKIGAGVWVEAIVQSMGWHHWSEVVQEWGCRSLKNLASNNADIRG
jgi:hypothetical protein